MTITDLSSFAIRAETWSSRWIAPDECLTSSVHEEGGSGPGEFRSSTDVAIWKGELFILDSKNARIQRFDLCGKFQSQFKISPSQGLATDGKALYLSQPSLDRIDVLDHDGSLLLSLKSKSGHQFDPAGSVIHPKALSLRRQ